MKINNQKSVFLMALVFSSAVYVFRYLNLVATANYDIFVDFEVFYRVSLNLYSDNLEPYKSPSGVYFPYLYPPFFLYILYPFGLLQHNFSLAIWLVAQLILFIFAARSFFLSRGEILKRNDWLVFLALFLPFFLYNALVGQTGLLTSAILLFGFSLLDRKPILAGAVFALIMFKPQLALLLPVYFLANRNYKTVVAFVITFLMMCLISWLSFGTEIWLQFFAALKNHAQVLAIAPAKLNEQMTSIYIALRIIGLDYYNAIIIHVLVALVFIFFSYKKLKNSENKQYIFFAVMFLVSPYIFAYDIALISLVLFKLAQGYERSSLIRIALIMGSFIPIAIGQLQSIGIPFSGAIMLLVVTTVLLKLNKKI